MDNNVKYNPALASARTHLAGALFQALTDAGFTRVAAGFFNGRKIKEIVFDKQVTDRTFIRVYTTAVDTQFGPQVRMSGKDSIAVTLLAKVKPAPAGVSPSNWQARSPASRQPTERGIAKTRHVNRVGKVDAIVSRVLGRVPDVINELKCCKECGAPTFTSKKKNQVCVDFCWAEPRVITPNPTTSTMAYQASRPKAPWLDRAKLDDEGIPF